MTVSILVVDDEAEVAELFRQRFRREARQGTYAMHFANSGAEALSKLADGIEPSHRAWRLASAGSRRRLSPTTGAAAPSCCSVSPRSTSSPC
jgi:hypothetical protein